MTKRVLLGVLACLVLQQVSFAADDPKLSDYYWGKSLQVLFVHQEQVFYPQDNRANFTFFDGVDDVAVVDGKLQFMLSGKKATLGWGNYLGRQPVSEIVSLWTMNSPVVKVRQSCQESKWTLRWWADGKRIDVSAIEATLKGNDWTELQLKSWAVYVPNPDGLEIEIEAPKGTTFEIEHLKIIQPRREGYLRKEFTLPPGKIWRAIAEVGGPPDVVWNGDTKILTPLYINGKEVKRIGPRTIYDVAAVDIGDYLKPGKNCVAFYGFRVNASPYIFFQARIIMTSGEVITWQTDETWKYSPQKEKGWNQAGFDDSQWKNASLYYTFVTFVDLVGIPAYSGRLVIKNPYRKELFYVEGRDVIFDVQVPEGLKAQTPALDYTFARADESGKSTPVKEGSVSSFNRKGSSLIYRVNVGQQPGGVYTIVLLLKDGRGSAIEERPREALMVTRKLTPKEIVGKDYREGLDLELEDEIDFTNLKEAHPSIESIPAWRGKPALEVKTPTVIRKKGLVYRETADVRGSMFSYRIQFKHPGDFYLMELDYPDDAERELEVSISTKIEGAWTNSQSGVGVDIGRRFYLTGKMQTLRWIHVADSGVQSVDVINVKSGTKAAAKTFRMYHIKGDLPSVGSGSERLFGIHTERCYYTSGIGRNFGVHRPLPRKKEQEQKETEKPSMMEGLIKDLFWMRDTTERYVQYLRFAGQNTHIMGCYQCNEYNTPFVRAFEVDTSQLEQDMKTILGNIFEVNGINFYAGIQWSQFRDLCTFVNNAQVAQGADTIWMVNAKGEQYYGNRLLTVVPNWLDPRNRQGYQQLMREVTAKFGHLSRFKGIHIFLSLGEAYYLPGFAPWGNPDPFLRSYDDVTFSQFEKDTGLKLPVKKDDPKRFEKRYSLVQNPTFRKKYVAWRCRKLQEFLAAGLDALKADRKDLEMMAILPVEFSDTIKHWLSTGKTFKDWLKDFGADMDLLHQIKGLWVGRWTISWRQGGGGQDPYLWIPKVDPRMTSAYDRDTNRYVFARTSWDENMSMAPGYVFEGRYPRIELMKSDWIMNCNRVRALPQPSGYHARETMIQGIIANDPDALMYGCTDLNINVGHEQVIRELARVFTHLPKEKFQTVLNTGFETNFVIRKLSKGGQSYFYVVNPGYWHAKGTLTLRTDGRVSDLVTGKTVKVSKAGGRIVVPVSLDPYGLVAYRVSSPRLEIESYSTSSISKAELSYMQGIMDRVADIISKPEVKLVLTASDGKFMAEVLQDASKALEERNYGLAWSRLTNWRFWILWKDFLEKAAQAAAFLPDSIKKENSKVGKGALRTITALRTGQPITVDGKLDEASWEKTPFSVGFVDKDRKPTLAEIGVKALYDDNNIYFGFICADKDPTSLKVDAEDEKDIFAVKDDVLAIFVQPDETAPIYYQLAFNARGVQFDQKVVGNEKDYVYHPDWKMAAFPGGKYWTAEVALAYEAFGLEGRGKTNWRVNFHRVVRNGLLDPASWSLTGRNWHDPGRFGKLVFEQS